MDQYLQASKYFDYDDPKVKAYGESILDDSHSSSREIAIALYQGVRDDIRYNAYTFNITPESFSASYCLDKGESYCIPKAVLFAALCRRYSIPARIGLADVKNHLASPQFLEYLQSDVFVMHGYTEVYLDGKWVKATPAFDAGLCKAMNVHPLEFNGIDDSIFHEFDNDGEKHMEYLKEHGVFEDVPQSLIVKGVAEAYPHLVKDFEGSNKGNKSLYSDMQLS
jgi:transglutaminase-like putative cysteine protease